MGSPALSPTPSSMASPNNYLFEDESATTDRKLGEPEELGLGGPGAPALGPVERIGLPGPSAVGGMARYLHHSASAGYWPPLIYDWPDSAIGPQSLQQQQPGRESDVD